MTQTPDRDAAVAATTAALQHLVAGQDVQALEQLMLAGARLRLALARQHLTNAFHEHAVAVFVREPEQVDGELLILEPAAGSAAQPYDATAQAGAPEWMSPEQWQAVLEAERLFSLCGHEAAMAQILDVELPGVREPVTLKIPLQ